MSSIIQRIKDWWHYSKYTTNQEAAEIIRRLVHHELADPYEWDDFESVEDENPEVNLALNLCWYFANKYPEATPAEYCGKEALPYFLMIAEALEKNLFRDLNHKEIIETMRGDELPDIVKNILESVEKSPGFQQ